MDGQYSRTTTDVLHGGDITSECEKWKQSRTQQLSDAMTELNTDVEDIAIDLNSRVSSPEMVSESAVSEISAISDTACTELELAEHKKRSMIQTRNVYCIKHNIDREAMVIDLIKNIIFLLLMASVEGLATGMFFVNGGFTAGIGEALALGLVISGVNILLSACIGGFVCGRYWNFGINCREDDPVLVIKRWFARVGGVVTVLALLILLISSGIVRATGETENIVFSLENLAVAASDFHSLMLWAIGMSFSVLAWKKGMIAFSDPYPGLSAATQAVAKCNENAGYIHEDAHADIEEVYFDAIDELADAVEGVNDTRSLLADDLHDIRHQLESLVANIYQAETDFEAFRAERINLHKMVSGNLPIGHDTAPFIGENLRLNIPKIDIEISNFASGFPDANKNAHASLVAVKKSATEAVNVAYRQTL